MSEYKLTTYVVNGTEHFCGYCSDNETYDMSYIFCILSNDNEFNNSLKKIYKKRPCFSVWGSGYCKPKCTWVMTESKYITNKEVKKYKKLSEESEKKYKYKYRFIKNSFFNPDEEDDIVNGVQVLPGEQRDYVFNDLTYEEKMYYEDRQKYTNFSVIII